MELATADPDEARSRPARERRERDLRGAPERSRGGARSSPVGPRTGDAVGLLGAWDTSRPRIADGPARLQAALAGQTRLAAHREIDDRVAEALGKDGAACRIVGIDLGTTNSLVAYVDDGRGCRA